MAENVPKLTSQTTIWWCFCSFRQRFCSVMTWKIIFLRSYRLKTCIKWSQDQFYNNVDRLRSSFEVFRQEKLKISIFDGFLMDFDGFSRHVAVISAVFHCLRGSEFDEEMGFTRQNGLIPCQNGRECH